jgi:hypothetical protein
MINSLAGIVKGASLLPTKTKSNPNKMKITTKQLALLTAGVGLLGILCTWALNKANK